MKKNGIIYFFCVIDPTCFFSVDLDDFRGYCGTGKYPLIKAMRKEMEGYLVKWTYKGPFETPLPGQKPKKKKQLCQVRLGPAM